MSASLLKADIGQPEPDINLVLHFQDGFVLIHDHYAKQPERRGTDYLAPVPMFAFDILSVASFHNVVRFSFHLCGPFTGKDQMEFIPMMKVKRNHVAGGHFVDIGNDLLVGVKSTLTSDVTLFPAKPG